MSKDAEQLPRESSQQECNQLNSVNGNAEHESPYERFMQYEPSSSIFPLLMRQEPSCTPAQVTTSAVGETVISPVVARKKRPVSTPLAAPRLLSRNGNIDDESIPDFVDSPFEETYDDVVSSFFFFLLLGEIIKGNSNSWIIKRQQLERPSRKHEQCFIQ